MKVIQSELSEVAAKASAVSEKEAAERAARLDRVEQDLRALQNDLHGLQDHYLDLKLKLPEVLELISSLRTELNPQR